LSFAPIRLKPFDGSIYATRETPSGTEPKHAAAILKDVKQLNAGWATRTQIDTT
jgi:hypothetical protein